MERADDGPRRIETVSDVEAVLGSSFASFVELMDCVAVAKTAGEWRLRHRAAERAFLETGVGEPASFFRLSGAAEIVVDNYLKFAGSIVDLPTQIEEATRWLETHRLKLNDAGASAFVVQADQLLAELQVLLSDAEPETRVRLCSRLRRVDRSDLAIEAVRDVANADRGNVPALTTLGAAYCDMGNYEKSERALRAALRARPGENRAQVALSRTLQCAGRISEAHELAKVAFSSNVNSYSAHRLLAAAAAVGDSDSFDEAVAEVERAAESRPDGSPDVYLLLLAAEALIEQGRAGEVGDLIARVVACRVPLRGLTARRFAAAKRAMAPTLFELPPAE